MKAVRDDFPPGIEDGDLDQPYVREEFLRRLGMTAAGLTVAGVVADRWQSSAYAATAPTIPRVTINLTTMPFMDHSYAVIGVRKGWFEEVGVHPKFSTVPGSESNAVILAGRSNVGAEFIPGLIPAQKQVSAIRPFFWGNHATGFGIVGKPEYKTPEEFMKQGLSPRAALAKAVQQMKGKVFIYESSPNLLSAINYALSLGGLTLNDVKGTTPPDNEHVALMKAGRGDFEVDGIPQRVTLQLLGFKPIISWTHMAKYLKISTKSPALNAIGTSGWASRKDWLEKNHDTALRVAGVGFRIIDLIKTNLPEALKYWLPYYNSISGTGLTIPGAKILVRQITDFRTFEQQTEWYQDPKSIYYYKNWMNVQIGFSVASKIYKKGEVTPDSTTDSQKFWSELLQLKRRSKKQIDAATVRTKTLKDKKAVAEATALLSQAKRFYVTRNYLDADRFSKAALEA